MFQSGQSSDAMLPSPGCHPALPHSYVSCVRAGSLSLCTNIRVSWDFLVVTEIHLFFSFFLRPSAVPWVSGCANTTQWQEWGCICMRTCIAWAEGHPLRFQLAAAENYCCQSSALPLSLSLSSHTHARLGYYCRPLKAHEREREIVYLMVQLRT